MLLFKNYNNHMIDKVLHSALLDFPEFVSDSQATPTPTHTEFERKRECVSQHTSLSYGKLQVDTGELCVASQREKVSIRDLMEMVLVYIEPQKLVQCRNVDCTGVCVQFLHDRRLIGGGSLLETLRWRASVFARTEEALKTRTRTVNLCKHL